MVRFLVLLLCGIVFAQTGHNTVYDITDDTKFYSADKNYYEDSTQQVRFKYTADHGGTCGVQMRDTINVFYKYLYFYGTDESFSSRTDYDYASGQFNYTFSCTAGITYYFAYKTYSTSYSSYFFGIKSLQNFTVKRTSASTNCYVDASNDIVSQTVLEGTIKTYTGYGYEGYKPNGWKAKKGFNKPYLSNYNSITDTIDSDVELELQCTEAQVYDITTTQKQYSADSNFYGNDQSSGVRFKFESPDTKPYAIRAIAKTYMSGYQYFYDSDPTFTNLKSSKSFSNNRTTTFVKATSAGQTFYTKVNPNTSYYSYVFLMDAVPASTVSIKGKTQIDTVITGDTLVISAAQSIDTGYTFVNWEIESGKGSFVDSTAFTTKFIPTSENVSLAVKTKKLKIYSLTDSPKKFIYQKNGTQTPNYYGIRTVYDAQDSGLYAIWTKTNYTGYIYQYSNDSSFTTRKTYATINSGERKYIVNLDKNTKNFYLFVPYDNTHLSDTIKIWVKPTFKVRSDTVGSGTVTVGVNSRSYDSTYTANDTVPLTAYPSVGFRLDYWEKTSGNCTIGNTKTSKTYAIIKGDCEVTAHFTAGKIYALTTQKKSFNYDRNGTNTTKFYGIKTSFTAPDSGSYAVLTSRTTNPDYFYTYQFDSLFTSFSYSAGSNVLYNRYIFTSDSGVTNYFLLRAVSSIDTTVKAWISKIYTAELDSSAISSTKGVAYIGNSNYYSVTNLVSGDSVLLRATGQTGYRFKKWTVSSGSCTIDEPTKRTTYLRIKSDCTVKPTFTAGSVYKVTKTATAYTTAENYFDVSANSGIRYTFKAPSNGTYAIAVSSAEKGYFNYYVYTDSTFSSTKTVKTYLTQTLVDTLTMKKGESVFFLVKNNYLYDSLQTFWVNYSTQQTIITLDHDSTGTTNPYSGYNPAWVGVKYAITANANVGYRFKKWVIETGMPIIDDSLSANTYVLTTKSTAIKATFKKGSIYPLTTQKQSFIFKNHYYSDAMASAIAFTWTPPDTGRYFIAIKPKDSTVAALTVTSYGNDSLFSSANAKVITSNTSFQGKAKKPLFFTVTNSTNTITNESFSINVVIPYVLKIVESDKGRVIPSGNTYILPDSDTLIYTIPFGGYAFKEWKVKQGNIDIEDSKKDRTRVKPISNESTLEAIYNIDLAAVPSVKINKLDVSNHPGICAQVTVTDENTGRTFAALESTDFILFQDNKSLPIQATVANQIGGVSVALVVDESGSMYGDAIDQAKDAMRNYVNEMGPYDKTAIVGFNGNYKGTIHQALTSNKQDLLNAINTVRASGGTDINNGALVGVQQLLGETNATAVIIFSDGDGSGNVPTDSVTALANSQGTPIYSIGIGGNYRDPLQYLAEGTGGSYTYAPSASKLTEIYTSIKSEVQAQYTICYQTPDIELNSEDHFIRIQTTINGKTAFDTSTWNEDILPPIINLSPETWKLVGKSQTPNDTNITIGIIVKSKLTITGANVFIRETSLENKKFSQYAMVKENDSLWTFKVPANMVNIPGIDFYATATDSTNMVGKSPSVKAPASEPYTIPVKNKVPEVTLQNITCVDTTDKYGSILFTITDNNGIHESRIYYRSYGEVLFKNKKMSSVKSEDDTWEANVPRTAFRDGPIEYYVRTQDKKGAYARWQKNANLTIEACKETFKVVEVKDKVKIYNAEDQDEPVARETKEIKLSVISEDFSKKTDTVAVSLKCLVSGDEENNITLIEKSSGFYETRKNVEKDEYTAKKENGIISCASVDTLIADYKDKQFGTHARDTVFLGDTITPSYRFIDEENDNDLDSVETNTSANFRLQVTAISPSIYKVDTLKVRLYTNKGDSIWVSAVETGAYTSTFESSSYFRFVESNEDRKDTVLDGVFDLKTKRNRVKIQASVKDISISKKKQDSLIVYSSYVPADSAEIYDRNLDGKADSIRIHFMSPLEKNIVGIDSIFWTSPGDNWKKVSKKDIKISSDSMWITTVLKDPFEYGLTAPNAKNPPYLRFTKTEKDFSQKVPLTDKVGAVPVKAVKHAGDISTKEFMTENPSVPSDTLVVTLSEPIKKTEGTDIWKDLFLYASKCSDTTRNKINLLQEPTSDTSKTVWTLILDNNDLLSGNCIFTNPESKYVDKNNNKMGLGGVKIEGQDIKVYIYDIKANPAVSKPGQKVKWIVPGGHSWDIIPDTISTIMVSTIAPYKANITIYDGLANVVTSYEQVFGKKKGEMDEPLRANDRNKAKTAFLYWNQRSSTGRKVGTGVYLWRIDFEFEDGHSEYRLVQTGIWRGENKKKTK